MSKIEPHAKAKHYFSLKFSSYKANYSAPVSTEMAQSQCNSLQLMYRGIIAYIVHESINSAELAFQRLPHRSQLRKLIYFCSTLIKSMALQCTGRGLTLAVCIIVHNLCFS